MELIDSDVVDLLHRERLTFEKVKELKYVEATLNLKKYWYKGINIRIKKKKKRTLKCTKENSQLRNLIEEIQNEIICVNNKTHIDIRL